MARTVDNLGMDVSVRYAEDQKNLVPAMITDAPSASSQSEIDTLTPMYPSELDLLFATDQRRQTFAGFTLPENYESQKKNRLFYHQVVPQFGDQRKKELQIERIQATGQGNVDMVIWNKESKVFLDLYHKLIYLDECLDDINGGRSQLQKG